VPKSGRKRSMRRTMIRNTNSEVLPPEFRAAFAFWPLIPHVEDEGGRAKGTAKGGIAVWGDGGRSAGVYSGRGSSSSFSTGLTACLKIMSCRH
jgi:hypothetical protein